MSIGLSASMMCARFGNLEKEVNLLESVGVNGFHLDVMDGKYVHNFGMGLQDIKYICKNANVNTEIHLMIENPGDTIDIFIDCRPNVIYIHPESEYHAMTTLQRISEAGIQTGIVLNPGTSVESILELLHVTNNVMVMGVNPGHAGQIYLPYAEQKIDKLIALKEKHNFTIGLDGACTAEKIGRLSKRGVSHFVLGTAALFKNNNDYIRNMKEIKEALDK